MLNLKKRLYERKDELAGIVDAYQTKIIGKHYAPHFVGWGCNFGDGNGFGPQYSGLAPKTETVRGQIAEVEVLACDLVKFMLQPKKMYAEMKKR